MGSAKGSDMFRGLGYAKLVWIPLAALAFAMTVMVACGSDDDKYDVTQTPSAGTAAGPAAATSAAATSTASGSALNVSVKTADSGSYLAGPDGKTLYVFLKDA